MFLKPSLLSKSIFRIFVFSLTVFIFLFSPSAVSAQLCEGNPLCDPATALDEAVKLVVRIISWMPYFAVLAGIIFLIIGGFKYTTAGDDVKQAELARSTIIYALAGIALSASIHLIMRILVQIIPGLDYYFTF
ncbi:hypothetical protein KKB83_03690 [Patescibacteria group bacterium]|nr:hypothetical protein [Patescibacteria group bacterium]